MVEHTPSNTRHPAAVLLGKWQKGSKVERQVIVTMRVVARLI